jgi:hypothetical protein
MPRVSEFFGITIYLYHREHLPPHFHAIYGGNEAQIAIDDLSIMRGSIPPRALGLVIEWATLHRAELRRGWKQALAHQPPSRIAPLK